MVTSATGLLIYLRDNEEFLVVLILAAPLEKSAMTPVPAVEEIFTSADPTEALLITIEKQSVW